MKYIFLIGILAFSLLTWTSCDKPPIYDDTPTIEWVGFSEDTIRQFNGIVTFEIGFTDGDGDLGRDNDTTSHIIIVDTRRTPNDTLFYQIPTIEPQGVVSGISGQIDVTMSQLCCINPSNPLILCQDVADFYDPVVFKIRIKDIAGRWSNEIETAPLYIQCFND
jgi:hypothetical protein